MQQTWIKIRSLLPLNMAILLGLALIPLFLAGCADKKVRVIGHWNKTIPEEVYANEKVFLGSIVVNDSAKPTLNKVGWADSDFVVALDQELRYLLTTRRLKVVDDSAAADLRLNVQIIECGISSDSGSGIQSGLVFASRKNRKIIRKMGFEELYERAERVSNNFSKQHLLRTISDNIISQTIHLDLKQNSNQTHSSPQIFF